MKQLYSIIFFFLVLFSTNGLYAKSNFAYSDDVKNVDDVVLPTATVTASVPAVCINGTPPVITFTGNGTAPYTFNYTLNGVSQTAIVSSGGGNTATLNVPTAVAGSFVYALVSVTDSSGTQLQSDSVTVTVAPVPVIDFTFTNDNSCSGTPIQFNSIITTGTAPYTYAWDFGDGNTSTLQNPNHSFTSLGCGTGTFTVKLTLTDAYGCVSSVVTKNVSVKQKPDINFEDANNLFDPFNNCSNASSNPVYSITVKNSSLSLSCITSYNINWGDGSTESNVIFPKEHTYNQTGAYNMVITAIGINGCTNTKNYVIKNVTNPAGGLVSPGSTQNLCSPTTTLGFAISNWGTNSLDTTYSIDYGDSTPIIILTQTTLNSSAHYNALDPSASTNYLIPHSYVASSCPSGSFTATLTVSNACSSTPFTTSNIIILKKPEANFNVPANACSGSNVNFINTTVSGYGQNCNSGSVYTWDFGDGSPIITTSITAPQNINHIFSASGTYNVILTAQNFCGTSTKMQQICIEVPLIPTFTLDTNSGCKTLAVTATNTTNVTNSCATPTYQWNIAYAAANCGTTSSFTYTGSAAANTVFNFVNPGTYSISLTATNSCGAVTSAVQTVTVKQPPTAVINAIADFCGPTSINPTAVVNGCAPASSALTYAWSFPGGSPASSTAANPGTISYTAPGTYTVSLTVSNECGVSTTANEVFVINDVPTLANTPLTQTICSGSSTALVNLTSTPTGATFTWTATATPGITGFTSSGTNTIPVQTLVNSGTSSGTVTYAVIPKIGTCTGVTTNYVITVNPAPQITAQPVSSSVCQNGTPTSLTFTLSGVTATPTYQWYSNNLASNTGGILIPGETNVTFSPPSSTVGTFYYYCEITLPSGGCSSLKTNVATVTITPLVSITSQPIPTQNVCVGSAIGTPLSVSYSGGAGTVSYQWYSNTSNSNSGGILISGATGSTYTPPVFTVPGPYYYYAIVTSSGNGCGVVTSNVAEIVVFSDPTISSQPLSSQTLCQGATPQGLQLTATGGNGSFSYQWYQNTANNTTSGTVISGAVSDVYTPSTSAVGTLYYYCLVTQNTVGCDVKSMTAEVIVNAAPTITSQPVSSTVCLGGTPTLLSVAYTNGVGTPTYQWYSNTINSNSGGSLISGAESATFSPPNTTIGTTFYYCVITLPASGGCSSITSNTANVTINSLPVIDVQPTLNQSICVGGTIANPLSVTHSGGAGTASYQWFSSATNTNSSGTPISGATSASYTPPAFTTAGNYYYYCQVSLSGNGCGFIASNSAEVVVVTDPIINTQPLVSQTLCQGGVPSDLTVTATGGIGTYSYQWYFNTTNSNSGGLLITNAINATYIPLTTSVGTIYYYCVVSQSGIDCGVVSATSAVIVNTAPTFTKQPQSSIICLGNVPGLLEVAFINGAGTPQYQWFSNTLNSVSGGTIIPTATSASYNPPATTIGTLYYYCVVTLSSGGCSSITSNSAEVTINPNPIINPESTVICSGTTFTVTPGNTNGNSIPSGTKYTWTNPVISPANSVNGASAQTVPQTVISQTLTNSTTNPATVTYTVTPVSGVCVGANFTVTVTVNPSINANVTIANSTCFGANNGSIQTNITGGIPFGSGQPYIVSWTGPGVFSSSALNISNLAPGVYDLTIQDAGGCPFSKSYTVNEPNAILITTNLEKNISCFGAANGQISLSVTGGSGIYTYSWTKNGTPFAGLNTLTNLSPGTYQVTVNDSNSCGPKTAAFTITEPPVLDVTLINQTDVLCFGASTGAINVGVTGGTPSASGYTFAWTGPNSFTSTAQNLTNILAGTYTLTVTDASGCTDVLTVVIKQPTEVIIAVTTTPIICYGGNNASINLSISGGVGPYQTVWNTLATGTFQNNLSAGNYQITVTDANNCSKIVNVTIPEAPIFTINPVVKQISCFGAHDGSINLNLTGGIAPVALVWNDGSTSGLTRNNLGPGTYTVTITDSKPCVITRTFVIQEPQMLVLGANVTDALDCTNANSGAINLLVAGGTSPFSYSWTNGATTEDLANIPGGNYMVTVTDARGCSKTAQYAINRPKPIAIAVSTETVFNCDTKSVSQKFTALASGGVPPFTYNWSSGTISGTNNTVMETNQSGLVVLVVTDALGCKANYSLNVEVPVIGDTSFSTSSHAYTTYGNYSIKDPIQFTNLATGDYSSIVWDFGDGSVSTEENPVHSFVKEGSYVITQTVSYSFGCVYTHTVTLTVDKGYKLVSPNGFTPNGDGINDTFKPLFAGLNEIQLDVYDTWGELIYSEKGLTLKGWDGKIKGRESENGNYYYKVMAITFYGIRINEKGPFTLIK